MEKQTTPQTFHETNKRSTPWGLFIGLFLILAIIVSGAYYTLEKRIGTLTPSTSSAEN